MNSYPISNDAIVLFSGGQDSTTCLAWALQKFDRVRTIGFDYGQTHAVELECRTKILATLHPDGQDDVFELPIISEISISALTGDFNIPNRQEQEHRSEQGNLPLTFVGGRNIMFLTAASMLGRTYGCPNLVMGVCETDYSGYPDCRDVFIKSMAVSLTAGLDKPVNIHTPLMFLTKFETWKLAFDIGGQKLVDLIIDETHTCYRGERGIRHAWGYGCDACTACEIRKAGYAYFEYEFSSGQL